MGDRVPRGDCAGGLGEGGDVDDSNQVEGATLTPNGFPKIRWSPMAEVDLNSLEKKYKHLEERLSLRVVSRASGAQAFYSPPLNQPPCGAPIATIGHASNDGKTTDDQNSPLSFASLGSQTPSRFHVKPSPKAQHRVLHPRTGMANCAQRLAFSSSGVLSLQGY